MLFDERTGSLSPLHQRIGEYGNSGNLDNDSDVDSVLGNNVDSVLGNNVDSVLGNNVDSVLGNEKDITFANIVL